MDRVSKAERELVRKIQKQTNADRIRAMSDEELAAWVVDKGRTFGEEYEGYMSLLDWLRQEATE